MYTAIITEPRNKELISCRWEDLDLERKVLRLGDTKAGRPFYLPLSDAAVDIFKRIPREDGNPWIFPSHTSTTGHWLQFPRKPWYRVRERAGMPDLDIHSLRHTLASWMASGGESMKIIAGALNQSSQSITEQRYAHLADDPLRRVFDAVGEKIGAMIGLGKEKG